MKLRVGIFGLGLVGAMVGQGQQVAAHELPRAAD